MLLGMRCYAGWEKFTAHVPESGCWSLGRAEFVEMYGMSKDDGLTAAEVVNSASAEVFTKEPMALNF